MFQQLYCLAHIFLVVVFIIVVLVCRYRREDSLELNDIVASNRYNIDTTGLVCKFPIQVNCFFFLVYCVEKEFKCMQNMHVQFLVYCVELFSFLSLLAFYAHNFVC